MTYYIHYLNNKNEIRKMLLDLYESEAFNTLSKYTDVDIKKILYIEDIPEVEESVRSINLTLHNIERRLSSAKK